MGAQPTSRSGKDRQSIVYLLQNGVEIDDDECVVTDHGYHGESSVRATSAPILKTFKDAEKSAMTPEDRTMADQLDNAIHSFRASCEQMNGFVKHSGGRAA